MATTVASTCAETSFSKPKIVKNYRRSARGQQGLHGITVIWAELVLASQLNSDEIGDHLRKWKQGTKTFKDTALYYINKVHIILIFTTRPTNFMKMTILRL